MFPWLSLTRRQLIGLGLTALVGGAGTLGYAFWVEPFWIEVVQREMPIANLPPALEGKTLVQLSDLHAGPRVSDEHLLRGFEIVNALEPDLLVITGDFMSCERAEQVGRVCRLLESLRPGRLGTYAILGNHDYGSWYRHAPTADSLCARVGGLGIRVLRNQRASVAGLTLVGMDDLWGPNWSPHKAMAGLSADAPALVLCHNPDGLDQPGWGDYTGWVLSGHTHGGQCKPPFLPPPMVPVKNKSYTAGEIALDDGRRVYINRALGFYRQVRFNCPAEITVFRLTADG
jgi:predicted MPP superfamily phosphohydrolase